MFVLVKIIIQHQIGCSYINKKRMCHQTFQLNFKPAGWRIIPGYFMTRKQTDRLIFYGSVTHVRTRDLPVQFNSIMRFSKTCRYLRLQIFLSREGKIVYLYLKNNWNSNFTKLSMAEKKKNNNNYYFSDKKCTRLLVLGFLQAWDQFFRPGVPDHRLISKTASEF
jgi:hypothetical protein